MTKNYSLPTIVSADVVKATLARNTPIMNESLKRDVSAGSTGFAL
jgi:hypothetical protein